MVINAKNMDKEKKFNDAQLDDFIKEEDSYRSAQYDAGADDATVETRIDVSIDALDDEAAEGVKKSVDAKDKKIKNLVSLIIVLGGLFLGSLFVDMVQLLQGGGFSQRAIMNADVLSAGGKTWVAFADPIVKVQVISDDTCEKCAPDEMLLGLRRVIPTILTEKVDINSEQGKYLAATFNLKTIPAFIFSKEIEKTEIFTQAEGLFDNQGDLYALKTADLGMPAGKYIKAPSISDADIKLGSDDAPVKIIEFSDFQCPYCKQMHQDIISQISKDYGDRVQIVFKDLPLDTHPQANAAALAGACASEQGKFLEYASKLFAAQSAWGQIKDSSGLFKSYALEIKLNPTQFAKCLSDKKYQSLIDQTKQDAQDFGIQGTPVLFVGSDEFFADAKYDDVKKVIDAQLEK